MDDLFDPRRPPKPSRLDAALWRVLDAARRQIDRGEPLEESLFDEEMRSRSIAHRQSLRELNRPGTRAEILEAFRTLVDLRGGHKAASLEEAKYIAEQRVCDLGIVPIWALWDAATATRRELVARGVKAGSRPKDGELLILARRYADPFFEEERLLDKVLRAPVISEPTPADRSKRKEMGERLRAMAATLGRDQAPLPGSQAARR